MAVCCIQYLSLMVKALGVSLVSSTEMAHNRKGKRKASVGYQQSVRESLFRSRFRTDVTVALMRLTTLYGREETAMCMRLTTQPFQKSRGMGN